MIIPDRVIICGITVDVKMDDYKYSDNDGILGGSYYNVSKTIFIYREAYIRKDNKLEHVIYSTETMINTFYHEYFHAMCRSAGYFLDEDDNVHTELNANLFANIVMVQGNGCDLIAILEEFKTIVTNINEQDYRKLEYMVKHTKFEFDNLQHIDEDSEIVDDINIAD